jgi:hypothetical protein
MLKLLKGEFMIEYKVVVYDKKTSEAGNTELLRTAVLPEVNDKVILAKSGSYVVFERVFRNSKIFIHVE